MFEREEEGEGKGTGVLLGWGVHPKTNFKEFALM